MRYNYDLLPGDWLGFDDIIQRYALKYPADTALDSRDLLSPTTTHKSVTIRAVFARQQANGPIEDILFICGDNERKNYLHRFEHYLANQQPFYYFRRDLALENQHRWQVMGEVRVCAMIDPASPMAQNLMNSRGYRLALMRSVRHEEFWQLFDPHSQPCFVSPQTLQFIVVLSGEGITQNTGIYPGTQLGMRVKKSLLARAGSVEFQQAVKARYGACVITGTLLSGEYSWPWVEACHVDDSVDDQGVIADNSVDNGLFLRSDLQRLFCSHRLSIDGQTGEVRLRQLLPDDHSLRRFYPRLEGRICALWLRVPAATRARLRNK